MDRQILEDCDRLALAGKMTFPDSIRQMTLTGVERYRADLTRMVKTHYSEAGEIVDVTMKLTGAPAIADDFNSSAIKDALTAIQTGRIEYDEFLRHIMKSGCTDYGVWLKGRKAIYFGRAGDFYVENFPAST